MSSIHHIFKRFAIVVLLSYTANFTAQDSDLSLSNPTVPIANINFNFENASLELFLKEIEERLRNGLH